MNGAAQAPAGIQTAENGGNRRELPPDLRAVVVRALIAAVVAEIRGEK